MKQIQKTLKHHLKKARLRAFFKLIFHAPALLISSPFFRHKNDIHLNLSTLIYWKKLYFPPFLCMSHFESLNIFWHKNDITIV